MTGILGLIDLARGPLAGLTLQRMRAAMGYWNPTTLVPDDEADPQSPGSGTGATHRLGNGHRVIASGRIDNRDELRRCLGLSAGAAGLVDDSALIARAYLHWGEACAEHLHGDWALAAWNPHERRVFLARDRLGNTSLYYTLERDVFAFASSRKALLVSHPRACEIDDLYIAQVLLSWAVYQGQRTAHRSILRVPPAHTVTVCKGVVQTREYWRLQDAPRLAFKSIDEASEAMLPLFDEAVRCRIPVNGVVGTTLSGGLDSGSVSATAALLVSLSGARLTAYTSVPLGRTSEDARRRFGDEWELASATARYAGITEHQAVTASSITPLQGLRNHLWAHDEPTHAVSNCYWLDDLGRTAKLRGCGTLLTGQGGNATISWHGGGVAAHVDLALRQRVKRSVTRALPLRLAVALNARWWRVVEPWRKSLAIHPDLFHRVHALEASIDDEAHPIREQLATPRERRLAIVKPGRSIVGCLHAENGAAAGIDVVDPTLDARLVEFCLAVPNELFADRQTGCDRLLIRTAMKDRLPEEVRMNRRRGLQAADLCARLRTDARAMEEALADIEQGPARGYVDGARLRQAWRCVQQGDSPFAHREASVVLLRSIMAGLFVNYSARSQ